jgi:hypothetical protein
MVQSTIEPRRQQPQPLLQFAHNVFQDGDFFCAYRFAAVIVAQR